MAKLMNLRVREDLHKSLRVQSYKTGLPISTLTQIAIENVLKLNLSELINANNVIKAFKDGVERGSNKEPVIVKPDQETKVAPKKIEIEQKVDDTDEADKIIEELDIANIL